MQLEYAVPVSLDTIYYISTFILFALYSMQPGRTAGLTERVVISVYVLASQLDKGTPTRSN